MGLIQPPGISFKAARKRFGRRLPRVAFLGDSITSPINTGGFWMWARFWLRHRIDAPESLNFGNAGDTTQNIIDRLEAALAARADIIVMMAGTNDLSGSVPFATTIANYRQIFSRALATGCRIVVLPVTPRATLNANIAGLNSWLAQFCYQTPDMYFVPAVSGLLADVNGTQRTGMFGADNLHPTPAGAAAIGQALADVLAKIIDPLDYLVTYQTFDQYNATYAPQGNLLLNPALVGSAGTVGSPATGVVATSWSHTGGDGGGGGTGTLVCSQEAAADGNGDWQVMTVTNRTYTNNTDSHTFGQTVLASANKYAPGDVVEASCELDMSASVGLYGFSLILTEKAGTGFTDVLARDMRISAFTVLGPSTPQVGLLKTGPITVRAWAGTGSPSLNFGFNFYPKGTHPGGATATIKVRRPTLRRVLVL